MIEKIECEALECDNCKEIYENSAGYSIFADNASMKEDASEDGWEMNSEDGKHYCEKCHYYDQYDEIVLDTTRTKSENPS